MVTTTENREYLQLIPDSESIRRTWIRSWSAMCIYRSTQVILCFVSGFMFNWEDQNNTTNILTLLYNILMLFFCYKYAYKKHGTKLLIFFLVTSYIGAVNQFNEFLTMHFNIYSIANLTVFFLINVWFLISSLNIINMNKLINKNLPLIKNLIEYTKKY